MGLSVAYKNAIGPHRTAWRALTSIETKEEAKASKQLPLLREYKSKIEGELNKFCRDILKVLDDALIPKSEGDNESKVFYLKMTGDYHRYMADTPPVPTTMPPQRMLLLLTTTPLKL